MSSSRVRWPSSRTMLSIQKKEASRSPRVTGSTRCRLVRRIEDHVAGRQLDRMGAVSVLDDQLAAVIVLGIGQEEGRRQVGADPAGAAGQEADRIVDMIAERMSLGWRA